jgi:hypothetical protein
MASGMIVGKRDNEGSSHRLKQIAGAFVSRVGGIRIEGETNQVLRSSLHHNRVTTSYRSH